ncbi:hypothetical protein [Psychrobacter sp. DAB_AL62B]|uniref:hypothetical protein n=1 Tax=Psychrobacter sp. DAB_AL62B TaxID=1028420 RepID=UPI00238140DF|nr:hypothetical protein [Psychrobacter sp. DAB_AL62B]MDE4454650.1 hypothetical protein [Psychrobacter sp. DAB_AL62B]
MRTTFHLKTLTLAIAAFSVASMSHAAGLDRSGQDIKGFFNPGTYAEIDFAYIDTDISGNDSAGNKYPNGESLGITKTEAEYVKGANTGNITQDSYSFMRYGVKTDVNENISIGLFYDEPWGAEIEYTGKSAFVSDPSQPIIADSGNNDPNQGPVSAPVILPSSSAVNPSINDPNYNKNTNVSVHTETWTGLIGYKSNGFQVYGGPVLQKAEAGVHLRGNAYGPLTGYDANVNNDTAYGWAAGLAYSKPEIALNAALTYRSEIKHKTAIGERIPLLGTSLKGQALEKLGIDPDSEYGKSIGEYANTNATVTTPESVNLNIQTGLSEKYQLLGTLDVRWVPWSDFSIVPPFYNAYSKASFPEGLPLLSYDKDQWKVDVGLAKRFNEKLAGSVVIGYDSGAGDPVSSLGTIDGYYSIGGGVKYNVTPEWAVSVGGKYLKFGDATGQLPNGSIVSKFEDNDGYIAGVKLSYQSQ